MVRSDVTSGDSQLTKPAGTTEHVPQLTKPLGTISVQQLIDDRLIQRAEAAKKAYVRRVLDEWSDPIPPMTSLTASRDATQVQAAIRERWGFVAPLEYCAALVDFVEALTDGQ